MRGPRFSGVNVSEEMDREGIVSMGVKTKREIWARKKSRPCHRPGGGPGTGGTGIRQQAQDQP